MQSRIFLILSSLLIFNTCCVEILAAPRENPKDFSGYNVILISLGNVGTKYMSLYGYDRPTTPKLEEWSKDAIVFNDAFVPASWTLPVGMSLFTSLQPYSHKVYHRRHNNILDPHILTMGEIFKKAGYDTASFTGGLDYDPKFGHMRGLPGPTNRMFTSLGVTLRQASNWLNQKKNKKFYLFIHGYDSHCPFNPPPSFKGKFSSAEGKELNINLNYCYRGWETNDKGQYIASYKSRLWDDETILLNRDDIDYLRDLYDEEVLLEDFLLDGFLKSLDQKLLSKTIIIIFADHGELFAKEGRFGRAGTIRGTYDDVVIHVPLVIKFPGWSGKRVDGLVQIIDLMPTLLPMMNLPVPKEVQGKNLMPLIEKGKKINRYVFGGTQYWPTIHYHYLSSSEYIRDEEWKLIRENRRKIKLDFEWFKDYSQEEEKKFVSAYQKYMDAHEVRPTYTNDPEEEIFLLYNLRNDPDELVNLYEKEPIIAEKLKKELLAWIKSTSSYKIKNTSKKIFSNEKLKEIRQGGYW